MAEWLRKNQRFGGTYVYVSDYKINRVRKIMQRQGYLLPDFSNWMTRIVFGSTFQLCVFPDLLEK